MAKPRVIISTDIGGADPNDKQELAQALLNTDKIDLKGLISTPTAHAGRVSDIYKTIDAYAQDYHNLSTWSSDYPTADHLKTITYQGAINVPGSAGYSSSTAASQAIVREAHAASPSDPLYVLAWGALTDVAQALHDDPSILPNIRLIAANGWNSTQDPNSYNYVYNHFKDLWFIESKSTHRGVYLAPDGSANNGFDMSKVTGSALGNYFKAAQGYMNDGDSFSLLYLLDSADNNNPTSSSSWGGAFVQNGHGAHYWTDNAAKSYAGYAGAATIVAHRSEVFNDFYSSFAHAKSANPNAGSTTPTNPTQPSSGDHPVVANDDTATATKNVALHINVMSNDSAPDQGHVTNINANSVQGGHVILNTDGTLTYTPKTGFIGSDSFGYMVKDADGDWDTATVHVTVKDGTSTTTPTPPTTSSGDHPVTTVNDSLTVQKGAASVLNVLANDSAPDGGLHVTNINANSAQGGHVVLNANSTLTYTPKAGFTGADSFGYMAKDADGDWGTATVMLNVKDGVATGSSSSIAASSAPANPTNGGLTAGTDSYQIDSGKTLYFNSRYLTANDKGGDGHYNVTSVDATSEHGVSVSWGAEGSAKDGTTTYKAPADFSGTDHVHYTVVDASGHTGTGTIDIQVHPLLLA